MRSFSIQWVQSANESQRRWTMQFGDTKSFFGIWRSVKRRELYKSDAAIFQCVHRQIALCRIQIGMSVLVVLKKVFLETMCIVVCFNAESAAAAARADSAFDYRKFNAKSARTASSSSSTAAAISTSPELKQMLSIAQPEVIDPNLNQLDFYVQNNYIFGQRRSLMIP